MSGNRILLLAPPGEAIYHRDGYCSTSSKGGYCWPPLDLLIQSGFFAHSQAWDVHVLDAVAERMTRREALSRVRKLAPDVILSLAASISLKEDMGFLEESKEQTGCRVLVSGDLFHFKPVECMERYPFLDGILMDYTQSDALLYLGGRREELQSFCYREGKDVVVRSATRKDAYTTPPAQVDLFPLHRYSLPFMRRKPVLSIGTQMGCPMRCSFCSLCQIPYAVRRLDDVLNELRFLQSKGVRELFVRDYTFNAQITRTKKLLRRMIEEGLDFTWVCEMVVQGVDEEMIRLLKSAGCHTVMFGAESGDDEILSSMDKGVDTQRIREVFRLCRRLRLRTLAHFVLGYPQDTLDRVERTIRFASELEATFASFNLYVPRIGSRLRDGMGLPSLEGGQSLDSSGTPKSSCPQLSTEDLLSLRKEAYRRFYLRPGRAWRILSSIKTWTELRSLLCSFGFWA